MPLYLIATWEKAVRGYVEFMPTYQIFTEYLLCANGSIYREKYEMGNSHRSKNCSMLMAYNFTNHQKVGEQGRNQNFTLPRNATGACKGSPGQNLDIIGIQIKLGSSVLILNNFR